MNLAEFMKFREELNSNAEHVLVEADQEYAHELDKFYNFKEIAALLQNERIGPYEVACIYFLKHVFSIVRGVSNREEMEGRFIDARNYTDLMAGLWQETRIEPIPPVSFRNTTEGNI